MTDKSTHILPMAFRRLASITQHPTNCWSNNGKKFEGNDEMLE